jgi:hypothetical protein
VRLRCRGMSATMSSRRLIRSPCRRWRAVSSAP